MSLPELKRKPSGIYYLDLRGEGLGRVSLGTRDRAVAVEKRRDIVLGVEPIKPAPKAPQGDSGLTMRELLERAEVSIWRDAKGQAGVRSNVKILSGLVGHEPVSAMTFTRLEKLVEEMRALGYAPATAKRKMAMVSRALKAATEWTGPDNKPLLDRMPRIPSIVVRNQKDRILSYEEEDQVFAAIEKRRQEQPSRPWARFAALMHFLLDTGARLGEATTVGPRNITTVLDDSGREVKLVTFDRYRTKSDKPRSVPLTEAAAAALDSRLDDLGTDPETGQWIFFPFRANGAWYMWGNIKEDMAALGFDISDVTLHTMRHTCLTRLAQGGMDLLRLQMWAGHSDPKITAERYLHLRPAQLLGGVDILQKANDTNHAMGTITLPGANRADLAALRH